MKPEKLYLRTDYNFITKCMNKVVSISDDIWKQRGGSTTEFTGNSENIINYFNDCTQPTQFEIDYFEVIYGKESKDAFLVWLESYQH